MDDFLPPPTPPRSLLQETKDEIRKYIESSLGLWFDDENMYREKRLLQDFTLVNFNVTYMRERLEDLLLSIRQFKKWEERYILTLSFFTILSDRDVSKHLRRHDRELCSFVYEKIDNLSSSSNSRDVTLIENNTDLFCKLRVWYGPPYSRYDEDEHIECTNVYEGYISKLSPSLHI